MIYTILRQNETAKWVCVKITHKVCEVMRWIPVKFKKSDFLEKLPFYSNLSNYCIDFECEVYQRW